MIIIDTLARNMGGDENSTQDMNAFIQHLDTYLRQPWKCCVLVVHHRRGMDKDRSRGSTALKGALDAEYKVPLDSGTKTIAV
jgi:RecA-family ATPase